MEEARVGLQASLLVRSAKTGELFVNFDPEILTQIREVNCMTRMNLEIPPFGIQLQQKQNSLKKSNQKLQVSVEHVFFLSNRIYWYRMWNNVELLIIWIGLNCINVSSSSIQFMLSENTRVRAKIQSVFEQLALPHVAKVRYDVKVVLQIIMHRIQDYIY